MKDVKSSAKEAKTNTQHVEVNSRDEGSREWRKWRKTREERGKQKEASRKNRVNLGHPNIPETTHSTPPLFPTIGTRPRGHSDVDSLL